MLTVKSWHIIRLLGVLKRLTFHLSKQTEKHLVPHMVLSRFESLFPLVSLILGCFIKILHQIWNNKRFSGELIESGWKACPSNQMTLKRCQTTIQEKRVYLKHDNRCNVIPILCSSFPAPMCSTYEAVATTESSCKNYGVKSIKKLASITPWNVRNLPFHVLAQRVEG